MTTSTPPAAAPAGAGSAGTRHRRAVRHAVEAAATHLDLHVGRTEVQVTLPPPGKLVFYATLAGAAALGVVDWPVALLAGIGHLLSDDQHDRTLQALGEALDSIA
jgi:hypothetical protein